MRARRPLALALSLLALWAAGAAQAPADSAPNRVIAVSYTYVPGDDLLPLELRVTQGERLEFTNYDQGFLLAHSVTADELVNGTPIFGSALIGFNQTAEVERVDLLPPGAYGFNCKNHPDGMHGTLIVEAPA